MKVNGTPASALIVHKEPISQQIILLPRTRKVAEKMENVIMEKEFYLGKLKGIEKVIENDNDPTVIKQEIQKILSIQPNVYIKSNILETNYF